MSTLVDVAVVAGGGVVIGAYAFLETPVMVWWAGVRDRWSRDGKLVDAVADGWVPDAPADEPTLSFTLTDFGWVVLNETTEEWSWLACGDSCPSCLGTGLMTGAHPSGAVMSLNCTACRGTGEVA